MMTSDPLIGEALDRLSIPEHRPGFTDELMRRIDHAQQEPHDHAHPTGAASPMLVEDDDFESVASVVELQSFAEVQAGRRPMSRKLLAGVASVAAVGLLAIGFSALRDDSTPKNTTIAVDPTQPSLSTTAPTTPTTAVNPVSMADLARAQTAVETFVDSLGRGDLDAAAAVVGPLSEAHTESSGGLRSWLQQSTEGHGAWLGSTDRVVTPVGFEPGLAVVVIQGTVQIEGTTETRTTAYPVRKAESSAAWLVEPFAYDLDPVPMSIVRSTRGLSDTSVPVEVTLSSQVPGTAAVSLNLTTADSKAIAPGKFAVFSGIVPNVQAVVTALFVADGSLYATALPVGVSLPAPGGASAIAVPFLDDATNAVLSLCATGDDASCDAAQVPGVLDDGAFSYFHEQCDGGDQVYCVLFDNLVEAELRINAGR